MKQCFLCKQEKDFLFFHKDKTTKTGYSSYCKSCKKIKDKENQRNYFYNEKTKQRKKLWRNSHPERKSAHMKVYFAIKKGVLIKQPCFICGKNSEAHHPDYSKPLDVVWLCSSHHRQAHNNI